MTRHDEPTQYAQRPDANAHAYSEIPASAQPDLDLVCEPYPAAQKWSRTIAIAALGLAAAFLLAFLTVHVVRDNGSVAETPTPVTPTPTTTVTTEQQVIQRDTTITIAPTDASRVPSTTTVTLAPAPPATMTNPLEPAVTTTTVTIPESPPATMTNPLEPAPATMTNPLEPAPATMTNPLEPAPATMTNPLEPPVGAAHGDDA